jgi:hypothetical protein
VIYNSEVLCHRHVVCPAEGLHQGCHHRLGPFQSAHGFRGKKAEWLPCATEYVFLLLPHHSEVGTGTRSRFRIFTHGDSQHQWMQQSNCDFATRESMTLYDYCSPFRRPIGSSQLILVNRLGLAVAKRRTKSCADGLHLQIFQEFLIEPGLLEVTRLSIIFLQYGQPFGDALQASGGQKYYGVNSIANPRSFSTFKTKFMTLMAYSCWIRYSGFHNCSHASRFFHIGGGSNRYFGDHAAFSSHKN